MKLRSKPFIKRAATVAALLAFAGAIAFVVIADPTENTLFPCVYNKTFHVHCPTCGATRAAYYFFTFRFGKAFYYHAYFTALSPVIGYAVIAVSVNNFADRKVLPLPKRGWVYIVVFIAGLICFGAARNFTRVIY